MRETVEQLLQRAAREHGHLCPGQVLGVRMAMLGCHLVGVEEPRESRSLLVWVEIDRCAADAIASVTGCKLGRRTLKYVDYGKMAATFLNMTTGRAVRIAARDDAREKAWGYVEPGASKQEAQTQAYKEMPDRELFVVRLVDLKVPSEDLPGQPVSRVVCQRCEEGVNDRRQVVIRGQTLCRACAYGAYYAAAGSGTPGRITAEGATMEPVSPREQKATGNTDLASAESTDRVAALILAGGESLRMGTAKPFVHWRGVALIEHVLERLRPIFDTIYIVAREPDIFAYLDVPVIQDAGRQQGPLMGLYSGLVGSRGDWCLAVGCDMPLISPGLLEHMRGLLGTSDIVAARVGGRVQPLPALYSKRCIPEAERLLGLGTTSLMPLIEHCRTTLLAERELATFDPDLMSFKDVDTPEELARLAAEVSA